MATEPQEWAVLARLQNGDILRNVVEFVPTGLVDDDGNPEVKEEVHPLVVVLTPECDLLGDFSERDQAGKSPNPEEGKVNSKVLRHVQCCDLLRYDEIRWPYTFNKGTWNRVVEDRDERYYLVPADNIRSYDHKYDHTDLYLDFKRVFGVPTDYLYVKLSQGDVERCDRIPEPWVNLVVQRCFRFQSRICVPDPSDPR